MAIPTFIQKSRINEVIYQIKDDALHISARPLLGRFKEYRLDLRQLDPDYQPLITRDYALLITPLITCLLSGLVLWGLMHQTALPREAMFHIYQWPAIVFATSLATAIRGSRRIEYFLFKNQWGKPALTIIREAPQAAECASFITTLVAHIEVAQSELPTEERKKLLARLADHAPADDLRPGQNKWKASIVLGCVATGFPLIPAVEYAADPSLFPIMFLLCVGGAALCVFSFLSNEPRRWWSVLGLALSLIPPFFYN